MKPLTAEEIAELRRLDRDGTPAPWRWDGDESEVRGPPGHEPHEDDLHLNAKEKGACVVETDGGFYGPHGADRELLPAARNALPRLLDEVERSRRIPLADESDVKKLLAIIERSRADLEMQRTAIADLQGACDAWEKRAKDAESATERSRTAVPTLLTAEEVASVNPYLIRARALLKRIEWSGISWDEHACPECSGEEPRDRALDDDIGHRPGCELAALIGAS